jgi:hypothetical protein
MSTNADPVIVQEEADKQSGTAPEAVAKKSGLGALLKRIMSKLSGKKQKVAADEKADDAAAPAPAAAAVAAPVDAPAEAPVVATVAA